MDANWRPTQGAESTMDTSDWRTQLRPDSRQRIVNKIMDTLKRHLPVSGQDGLHELRKIAQRFEEKIYAAATSQSDYLRKISMKMLTMEKKTQNTMVDAMQSNAGGPSNKPIDLGLQQQQLLSPQSGNSGMQPNQHSAHMVQQSKVPVQHQSQQNVTNLLQSQGQQSQPQAPQQQLMPQIQSQPAQMQQQLGMQQQPNLLQQDVQRRLQGSSSMLQQKNVLDQQKQPYQSQRTLSDSSSNSTAQTGQSGGDDWQEEVFQKIKFMKESYLPELTEMHQKVADNLHLYEPLRHQVMSERLEKQKMLKTILGRLIAFLQVSKGQIMPVFKEKMASCEKQIIYFINKKRRERAMSSMQSGQLPPPHMQLPSQPLSLENQVNAQMQSQPAQMQQQLGMQQQPNLLQQDVQRRLQGSSSMLQQKNVLDQQKQPYQSQRTLSDSSSNSTAQTGKSGGDDWQEEVFQKIKFMKESYLPELTEMHQKVADNLHLYEPLRHQVMSERLEKQKMLKTILGRLIAFLQVSKGQIMPVFKEKMASCEKQIIYFINKKRRERAMSSMQSGQLPPPHMQLPSQPLSLENQVNAQMQSTNLQSSVVTMPKSSMASLQHNSIPSISGLSTTQQNMINSMQPGANFDSSSVNSLQQVGASTLQQNSVNAPQQTNTIHLSSQGGGSVLQQNSNPLQPGSTMRKYQLLKQPQEEQMLQNQQLRHLQQRQLLQRQQMLQKQQQQLQQATKQQVPAHMQTHQMPTLHQINDINDVKMRQGLGVKPGTFQQHLPSGKRSAYPQQQFKSGGSYPVSSPHLLQAASPHIPQHSSPQVDQQNLPSLAKASTPLQSANSPSPPLAPSPLPADSEKPISAVLSVSNAENVGLQQTGIATVPAQSLVIGTPGISPSPLLAEFSSPDGAHGNALAAPSAKLTVAELPIERLIKAVKSLSSKDLSAAVSGIGSVVSMVDRIAGSAPGNGSRAAVGEDLVAMTKCRLQARNFIDQDGTNGTKRMRRHVSAMPLNVVSSPDCMNDSMKQLNSLEAADLDSATTASIKKPRIKEGIYASFH